MLDFVNSPSTDANAVQRRHTTAVRTAFVAGVFSFIIAVLLFANAYRMKVTDIRDEDALAERKLQVTRQSADEDILEEIRETDTDNRRSRFRHLEFSWKGSRLLLGGLIVFFAALKWAHTLKKKLPHPQLTPNQQEIQMRQAVFARRAVAVAVVGFCLVSLACALKREIKHGADEAVSPYPTMEEVYKNWGAFRGPEGAGVSAYTNIPDIWSGSGGKNIRWKTPIPLAGHSSPVVWGNRIFVTGADLKGSQVYCFGAKSGKLLWTGDVPGAVHPDGEPMDVMEDTGLAAPTPVTDGRRVYAIFATGNVAAFDYTGKRVWLRKLGIPDNVYGYSASLAIYQDRVFVQFDQAGYDDGLSKIIALDTFTGKTVWETPRPVGNSWSSPIVAGVGEDYRLITTADPWTIAYDPATGRELWRAECVMGDIASSPIYSNGMVFATEPDSRLVAIRTGGTENITETHVAWFAEDDIPDICSPVSNGEFVWTLHTDGVLTCYNVADGRKRWSHEFERGIFNASPGLVGDKLYLLSIKGDMHIVKAAGEFEEITRCAIDEKCFASPAFVDGRIYIRGLKNLYCIESTGRDKAAVRPYPTMEEVYQNWPAFRGPEGAGASAYANIPDKWDAESGQGILWKTPVPLQGHNSPLLWGDRIFLTGADAKKYVYNVYCFDAGSGKLLWTGDVPNALNADGEPLEVMEDTGLAACTGVTDGRRVYAIFATGNVAAFDYDGNRIWLRKLGVPDSVYGYSSSLAMYQDKVIVQFDQATEDDGLSKVIALDSLTGRTVWERKRPVGNSWASPIVAKVQDNWRLFTAADPWVIAYDPAAGREIWRAECIMGDIAPSPIYANGFVFAVEPYSRFVAVGTGGKGNVTDTHVAWFAEDDVPDICSPVSNGKLVWILTTDGLLTCYNVADGKNLWDHEFEGAIFNASPGLVGDKLYLLSLKGVMHIIEAAADFKEITTCKVGGKCFASPAFADGRIYIRTTENLFCIGSAK